MTIGTINVLVQIREIRRNLTPVSKQLADYILENTQDILSMSIKTLAQKSGTSDAAVMRFCKTLGYDGYRSFIVSISAALAAASEDTQGSNQFTDIQPGDDLESIIKNISSSNHRSIDDTLSVLDIDSVEYAVDLLVHAKKIIFCGLGASGLVCLDAQQKFTRINKICFAYTDGHSQLTSASLLTPEDAAILISNSGETLDILDALEVLNYNKVPTIAITRCSKSHLAESADCVLNISTPEIVFRSGAMGSRIAMFNIIDILYAAVVSRDYAQSKKYLLKTRKVLENKRK